MKYLNFPSFTYSYIVDVESAEKALNSLKELFTGKGGAILADTKDQLKVEISANSVKFGFTPYSNVLQITFQQEPGSNQSIKISVFRKSERKISISFFWISFVVCILSLIQKRDFVALIFPVFVFGFCWLFSILPTHPAHKEIRELVRFK